MITPTDSQWAAVRACNEHVLVEAGAGTGKTATVVQRILFLLGEEVRGERYVTPVTLQDIVAITFTRQAASDLKRDLRSALRAAGRRADAYAVDQARIGTIHGFCSDIVREHALRAGRTPPDGVLEEGEALAWAEGCVRDTLLAALDANDVPGFTDLLSHWDTKKVEGWALALMRSAHLARYVDADHETEERALLELARRSARRLEERLAAEAVIDYDRMITWTRDLLRDHASVRAALQRRIHTIIVDEFQDTDPAQREIAYLLADPASRRADTPRLMLVGDPKQSIYRFRGADVTVWSAVRRDFEEHGLGTVLRLQDNFRSVPSILDLVGHTAGTWLNTPVSPAHASLTDYEVAFHAVAATRPEPTQPAVEFLVVPPATGGKAFAAAERREREARGIARRMRELHAAGTPWRDIVLLLRSWTQAGVYAEVLAEAGIPVYSLRDDNFLETREVLDLVVALQAIRDPRDDLAVLGFLRSPFINLRDDTLLAIAVRTKRPYARALRRDTSAANGNGPGAVELPEPHRVHAAIDLLFELAALRDRIPAAELLDELLHRTGYMAHLALLDDRGAQAALNVRRFLQMIAGMEESSVGMVLRAVAERRRRGDRIPQARLHGEQDDVVLITSVHMAKGLDWPVVIYADMAAGGASDHDRLVIGREHIRLGEPETKKEEQPERWLELRRALDCEEEAEEKRVTYVALTRPKDLLILSGIPQGDGSRAGELARAVMNEFPALEEAADGDVIPYAFADGPVRRAAVRVARGEAMPALEREDAAPPPMTMPRDPLHAGIGLTRHSATELLAFSRCRRRHRLKYVFGIREPRPEPAGDAVLVGSIARGQIVHDVLERYEEDAELDRLLEDAIGRWDEGAPPPDTERGLDYRSQLTDEIARVLGLPDYAQLTAEPGARRELGFLHVIDGGTAMQGAIDLASPGRDGVTLIDVKTSRIDAADAPKKAAEYAPQQDAYVAAAAAIGPLPVRKFGFVFSAPGTSATTALDAPAAAAAAQRVRNTLTSLASAPDGLAANPRECFFCGYRRVRLCPGVESAARPASESGSESAAAPASESAPGSAQLELL